MNAWYLSVLVLLSSGLIFVFLIWVFLWCYKVSSKFTPIIKKAINEQWIVHIWYFDGNANPMLFENCLIVDYAENVACIQQEGKDEESDAYVIIFHYLDIDNVMYISRTYGALGLSGDLPVIEEDSVITK